MSYFSAVIGRNGSGWRALDVDVEDLESLDEVAEHLQAVGHGAPVVAVLEREDEWFALIRVDEDSDWRAFVSDLEASQRGHYAELLAPVADLEPDEYAHLRTSSAATASRDEDDEVDDVETDRPDDGAIDDPLLAEAEADLAAAAVETDVPPAWAGDPGVLADLGVPAEELVALVTAAPGDPGAVVADLGERCGFDELLEALR